MYHPKRESLGARICETCAISIWKDDLQIDKQKGGQETINQCRHLLELLYDKYNYTRFLVQKEVKQDWQGGKTEKARYEDVTLQFNSCLYREKSSF